MRTQRSEKGSPSPLSSTDEKAEEIQGSCVRPLEIINHKEHTRCGGELLQRLIDAVKQAQTGSAFTAGSLCLGGDGGKDQRERRKISSQIAERSIGQYLGLFITGQKEQPCPCSPERISKGSC